MGNKQGGGSSSPVSGKAKKQQPVPYEPVISGPYPAGTFQTGVVQPSPHFVTPPPVNNHISTVPPPPPVHNNPPPFSNVNSNPLNTANQNCKYFLNGYCRNGTACTYKHDYALINTNVSCPLCGKNISGIDPNVHMDQCLGTTNNNYNTNYNTNAYNSNYNTNYNQNSSNTNSTTSNFNSRDLLKASVNSPFAIDCPYPGCLTKHMEARFFPYHVDKTHGSAYNHKFSCPVCQLMTGVSYSATDQTNLLTHIRTQHQDMIQAPDQSFGTGTGTGGFNAGNQFGDFLLDDDGDIGVGASSGNSNSNSSSNTTTTSTSTATNGGGTNTSTSGGSVGSRYIVQVLEEDMKEGECTICFEEFKKGENIARLECFCIFHEDCVVEWFKKSNNKCPLHKD